LRHFQIVAGLPDQAVPQRARCLGDRNKCLKRGTKNMPRHVQWLARQEIMTAAPKNAGPIARELRETLPGELWV
jgi:hypothetical protein